MQPAASAGASFQAAISRGKFQGIDLRADADGFVAGVAVHAGAGGDGQDGALDLGGPAGEVAQVRGGPAHVDVLREADRLAVVERLDLGELLRVGFDGEGERVHQALASGGGQLRPGPPAKAARAAATARSASSGPAWATWAISRPVEGSSVANVRPSAASGRSSPISRPWGLEMNSRAASPSASGRAWGRWS